ncbi:hypothetical protein F5884DRAFT_898273 [Xylogone sp. PMI_703]|nr:hypothetical protein F5884DRAFT_898273 [Xylogone sp. PMI_703]
MGWERLHCWNPVPDSSSFSTTAAASTFLVPVMQAVAGGHRSCAGPHPQQTGTCIPTRKLRFVRVALQCLQLQVPGPAWMETRDKEAPSAEEQPAMEGRTCTNRTTTEQITGARDPSISSSPSAVPAPVLPLDGPVAVKHLQIGE